MCNNIKLTSSFQDLWNAIEVHTGHRVAEMMTTWIRTPGFPIVHAALSSSPTLGIVLSQQPFLDQLQSRAGVFILFFV